MLLPEAHSGYEGDVYYFMVRLYFRSPEMVN